VQVAAFAREALRDGEANPARSAGDERGVSCELKVHRYSPRSFDAAGNDRTALSIGAVRMPLERSIGYFISHKKGRAKPVLF
jgi:hypothetical protein